MQYYHTWILAESQGGNFVSNFDGFSRAYVVKIRPSTEFLERGYLSKNLGGSSPPLHPCMPQSHVFLSLLHVSSKHFPAFAFESVLLEQIGLSHVKGALSGIHVAVG
jgi:hypothetical protein